MLNVGVVGVGHLGQHHARIFNNIENCNLVGIFDTNSKRAKEISKKLNVPAFDSYAEMLEKVSAVDISATTTYHYELAKEALEKGIHVFIEKPITSELWQAEELLKIAEEKNLKIQVGHIERFNPVVIKTGDAIKDPVFIESHRIAPFTPRGSDVPVILDLMIHDIDLILSFVPSKIKDIRASGVSLFTKSIDIANARLEFENGAIANVTSSRVSMKRERKIRFFQRDAYVSLDFQEKKVNILKKSKNLMKILPKILLGSKDFNHEDLVDMVTIDANDFPKDALTCELESFVDAVLNNKTPEVDGEAGTRALRIALDIVNKIQK